MTTQAAIQAMNYLIHEKGYTPQVAAGYVGNFMAESGQNLNPAAFNPNENAIGIAQWTPSGGRRLAAEQYAKAQGIPFNTLQGQLDVVDWENQGPENKAFQRALKAGSAGEAAAIVDQFYERSSGEHRNKRMDNAERLYALYSGNMDPRDAGMAGPSILENQHNLRVSTRNAPEGTILDGEEDLSNTGNKFHTGLALQGAASVLSNYFGGRAATKDLGDIRDAYFGRRDVAYNRNKKDQEQRAMQALFGDDPEMQKFIAAGGDPNMAFELLRQERGQEHQMGMQTASQTFQSAESAKDRALRLGIADANRKVDWARVAHEGTRITNQAKQFAKSFGLDEKRFDESMEQFALEHALDVSKLDLNTELGQAQQDLAELEFYERIRATNVQEGLQTDAQKESVRQFDAQLTNQKDEFKKKYGLSVEEFDERKAENQRQADQHAAQLGQAGEQWKEDYALRSGAAELAEAQYNNAVLNQAERGTAAKSALTTMAANAQQHELAAQLDQLPPTAFSDPGFVNAMMGAYKDFHPDPAKLTAEVETAQYIAGLDPNDPKDMAIKEEIIAKREAARQVDDPNAKKEFELYKTDLKALQASSEATATRNFAMSGLNEVRRILEANPDLPLGALTGGAFQTISRFAQDLGIDLGNQEDVMTRGAIESILAQIVPSMKAEGSGSISNIEHAGMEKAVSGITSPEGVLIYRVNDFIARGEELNAKHQFMQERMADTKSNPNMAAIDREWADMIAAGDPRTNQTVYDLTTLDPKNADTAYEATLRRFKSQNSGTGPGVPVFVMGPNRQTIPLRTVEDIDIIFGRE